MNYTFMTKPSAEELEHFLEILKKRFETHMQRHDGITSSAEWYSVQAKLQARADKLQSLYLMEKTGGEPDVAAYDLKTREYIFFDFSEESPPGRGNVVYDKEAEEWLKENCPDEKCNGNAVDMAKAMGVEILDEFQYREILQKKGKFDLKSMSWVKPTEELRKEGYALGGDRYGMGQEVDVSEVRVYKHSDAGRFRAALRV